MVNRSGQDGTFSAANQQQSNAGNETYSESVRKRYSYCVRSTLSSEAVKWARTAADGFEDSTRQESPANRLETVPIEYRIIGTQITVWCWQLTVLLCDHSFGDGLFSRREVYFVYRSVRQNGTEGCKKTPPRRKRTHYSTIDIYVFQRNRHDSICVLFWLSMYNRRLINVYCSNKACAFVKSPSIPLYRLRITWLLDLLFSTRLKKNKIKI